MSCIHPKTRELAQRVSGSDEIVLLWHPEDDRLEVSVCDITTGVGFYIGVAPANAMDAFKHPYAYAPRDNVVNRAVLEIAASADG
jgi:hypothetical protein